MTQINLLNQVDSASITSADLLPLWTQANGGTRKLSLSALLAWLNDQNVGDDDKVTQYAAPTTGNTVTLTDSQNSVWLILTPAGALATLTLKFPAADNILDKAEILINTTQILTSLTLDANGATIVGGISTLAANGFVRFRYDIIMQTWYRVG